MTDNDLINDDQLIRYYCNLLNEDKIEFIKDMETFSIKDEKIPELNNEKYKNIDKNKLLDIFKELYEDDKENKFKIIKKKKIFFRKLWPHFVRNAIRFLRTQDLRDKGDLKFDLGVENLTKYFEDFSEFEELLYGIDEFYRDHSLHVFRVYFLGSYLVREKINRTYSNLEIMDLPKLKDNNLNEYIKVSDSEKEAMWCVISLCHDLGYPLQKINNLNEKVSKILKYFGTYNFARLRFSLPLEGTILDSFILEIISSKLNRVSEKKFEIHIQSKYFTKYSNSYEKLSHGMMSCILLMKNLVYFKETDYKEREIKQKESDDICYLLDAKQYLIRREILRAIASHDCEDIYHIKMNNFLFLLIICDEIQEWNRPMLETLLNRGMVPKKGEEIIIKKFNKKTIDIKFKLPFDDDDLEKYARKKIRTFIRLLRSAVDSYKRNFNFRFVIKNSNKLKFDFIYNKPPDDILLNQKVSYDKPKVIRYKDDFKDEDYLKEIIKI